MALQKVIVTLILVLKYDYLSTLIIVSVGPPFFHIQGLVFLTTNFHY